MHELTYTPDWKGGTFNTKIELDDIIKIQQKDSVEYSYGNITFVSDKDCSIDINGTLFSLKELVRSNKFLIYKV